MLTEIEQFIFGGDRAHDVVELKKSEDYWLFVISPTGNYSIVKKFRFNNVREINEEVLTDDAIEYPLPIIGFESTQLPTGLWSFCLHVADIEWTFISEWPTNA